MEENVGLAFLLTTLAGLATAIGAGIAFFAKKTNFKLLSTAMGFSAGVMIYISFVELFTGGYNSLVEQLGESRGAWYATSAFFAGIMITAIIDKLVPSFENPHEFDKGSEPPESEAHYKELYRTGIFTALVIGIHNLVFLSFRVCRTCWSSYRLPNSSPIFKRRFSWVVVRIYCWYNGLYFIRSIVASGAKVRFTPQITLWFNCRNGRYGFEFID